MSVDPWGGGTDADPKLRKREKERQRSAWFNPKQVNPDRLPGERFDPPNMNHDRRHPAAKNAAGQVRPDLISWANQRHKTSNPRRIRLPQSVPTWLVVVYMLALGAAALKIFLS